MIFSAALFVLAVLLIGGVMLLQAQRAAVPVMRDVDVYAEQLRGLERDLAQSERTRPRVMGFCRRQYSGLSVGRGPL
jgi:hypothetical protein